MTDRRLVKHSLWNVAGLALPMLVLVYAVPRLLHQLGAERFGVLSLAWMVVGYFSLFDVGLGRAVTQIVARRSGEESVAASVRTALTFMLAAGVVGGALLALGANVFTARFLKVSPALQPEMRATCLLLSIAVPSVIVTAGFRGILEGQHDFGLANAIRLPLATLTYLAPVLVLPFSPTLPAVIASLVGTRVIGALAHAVACHQMVRRALHADTSWALLRPMLRVGGWMTVSNVISPLMSAVDRLFIGAVVSVSAVTFYATPYELVTKMLVIPGAIVGVLFPSFSAVAAEPRQANGLYGRGMSLVLLALAPAVLLAVALAPWGLKVWLGAEFARQSAPLLRILAVGVFLGGIAMVPFTHLQAIGRPHETAIVHLIEAPLYVACVLWAARAHGIEGVAIVWTARMALDATVLTWLSWRRRVAVAFDRSTGIAAEGHG